MTIMSYPGLESTVQEGPYAAEGSEVVLVLAPVDERDETGRVQAFSRAAARARLQPGILEAGGGGRPFAGLGTQQKADEVASRLTHALEVVLGEAEVQAADVEARLLDALVQEGRCAAQHNVRHHTQAPQV